MLSTKIRTIVIAGAGVAALSIPGVASAAVLVRNPVTVAPTPVVQPTTATPMKEAGSAGIPGYDDKKCGELLNEYNRVSTKARGEKSAEGKMQVAEIAGEINSELTSNCLVVD
jgi:hypothetical protein